MDKNKANKVIISSIIATLIVALTVIVVLISQLNNKNYDEVTNTTQENTSQ